MRIDHEPAEWTAADLRAERARQQVPIFLIAGKVGIHPGRLGQILNEKYPATPRMVIKIARALGMPSSPEPTRREGLA